MALYGPNSLYREAADEAFQLIIRSNRNGYHPSLATSVRDPLAVSVRLQVEFRSLASIIDPAPLSQ
jgi:hypothetical protein